MGAPSRVYTCNSRRLARPCSLTCVSTACVSTAGRCKCISHTARAHSKGQCRRSNQPAPKGFVEEVPPRPHHTLIGASGPAAIQKLLCFPPKKAGQIRNQNRETKNHSLAKEFDGVASQFALSLFRVVAWMPTPESRVWMTPEESVHCKLIEYK